MQTLIILALAIVVAWILFRPFSKKDDKVRYFQEYILTPKGIAERTKLTINFMKRKMKEYDELKKELKDL